MFIQVVDKRRNNEPVWVNTDHIALMRQMKHNTVLVVSGLKGAIFAAETVEEIKRMMEDGE